MRYTTDPLIWFLFGVVGVGLVSIGFALLAHIHL